MNTDTILEVRPGGPSSGLGFKGDVARCPRCERPLFYRVKVGRLMVFVHGDKSFCTPWSSG